MEILSVKWLNHRQVKGKPTAPILIGVAEPEQGDIIIDSGMLWNYQLHDYEPFYGDSTLTQCFRCYKFGHIARMCSESPTCGFCGGKDYSIDNY